MSAQRTGVGAWGRLLLIPPALLVCLSAAWADEGGGTVPPGAGQPTAIDVRVPLGAVLWFDGKEIRGTGALRRFVTPPLATGHRYYYDVKVTWTDGGRAAVRQRHVTFRPGERILVDFAPASRTQPEPTLFVDPAAPTPWRNNAEMDPRNWPNYPDYRRWSGGTIPNYTPNPAATRPR